MFFVGVVISCAILPRLQTYDYDISVLIPANWPLYRPKHHESEFNCGWKWEKNCDKRELWQISDQHPHLVALSCSRQYGRIGWSPWFSFPSSAGKCLPDLAAPLLHCWRGCQQDQTSIPLPPTFQETCRIAQDQESVSWTSEEKRYFYCWCPQL